MSKRQSKPGYGKAFTFHGSFVSLILARRREKEIPGSFIHQHKGRYYVLKPKKIRGNPHPLTQTPGPKDDSHWKFDEQRWERMDTESLMKEWLEMQKASFNKVFGNNASQAKARIGRELKRRGIKKIPNIFGDIEINKPKKNPRKKRSCYVIPNPRTGTLIYGRVLKIFAQKTSGPYKGERFVHEFKPGALMYGMPDGSLKIIHK